MKKDKSTELYKKKMKVVFELTNLEAAKELRKGFSKKSNLLLMYKELIKEQLG